MDDARRGNIFIGPDNAEMARIPDPNDSPHFKAKVLNSERLTPDMMEEIRELTLSVNDPEFCCKVNQSFGVLAEPPGTVNQPPQHRLYSISKLIAGKEHNCKFKCVVKRCNYIDSFTGEEVQGVVSNYLCSRKSGDEITITGPYPLPFKVPEDPNANLVLIGCGTGIAPFRAFIKDLYMTRKEWYGQIRLFYGSKNGLELLYMNNKERDLTQYYDDSTFKAFDELKLKPYWMDSFTSVQNASDRAEELLDMFWGSDTYIYISGHKKILDNLELTFSTVMGSAASWAALKTELINREKWVEVVY